MKPWKKALVITATILAVLGFFTWIVVYTQSTYRTCGTVGAIEPRTGGWGAQDPAVIMADGSEYRGDTALLLTIGKHACLIVTNTDRIRSVVAG